MPINRPTADELMSAIRKYRNKPDPDAKVDGYYQKIIAHLDALHEREALLGEAFARGERSRCISTAALLGLPENDLEEICRCFAEDDISDMLPLIIELWLPLAKEKLAIDSPRYRK
ncbi:hypothetical protein Y5S_01916 [Alcanivorax nanhaiticus]|uniref:Uncharacterized protein n=1 Tax=Alcanivorax nanhaiticus TaxID=1177154 RepID=A0A095TRI4_9GAMM|nr:hypothetical protein [Alcanivorax nanhaiticus]KGD65008.1 hypothetical protein Y5S_01916 [Alcanivorax nanhaiticus]